MLKKLLYLILFYSSLSLFAQNEDWSSIISKTEISIRKAQKEIISHQDSKEIEKLSNAVKYQMQAVKEWEAGHQNRAVCLSIIAREYSNQILSYFQVKGIDFYSFSVEEKTTEKTCECSQKRNENEPLISKVIVETSELTKTESLDNRYKISLN